MAFSNCASPLQSQATRHTRLLRMQKVVVIVGAGFSGTLTAINLLSLSSDLKVYLIDRRGVFGAGLAYAPPSDRFKLNVRAHAMGALPDQPEGFFDWLQRENVPASKNDFVSRRWYGRYLESLLDDVAQKTGAGRLYRIADEVVDIERDLTSKRYSVRCLSHTTIDADACIIAIGNLMRRGFGDARARCAHDPFSPETYAGLPTKRSICILGSSLTAVDAIMHCEGEGFNGIYTVISRHGRFPLPHEDPSAVGKVELPDDWEKCGSVAKLLTMVRKYARPRGTSQPVIDAMRPKLQQMWRHLSLKERRRFLRHVKPYWEIHRHRVPVEHSQMIHSLQASGRLHIVPATIKSVSNKNSHVEVELCSRAGQEIRSFDVAIMCAGPEGNIEKIEQALPEHLLKRGFLRAGALGLGVEQIEEQRREGFFLIGPLQREELWEITAVRELREEAHKVAHNVVSFLSGECVGAGLVE